MKQYKFSKVKVCLENNKHPSAVTNSVANSGYGKFACENYCPYIMKYQLTNTNKKSPLCCWHGIA